MNSSVPNESGGPVASSGGGARPRFGELAGDALRYWEPRRLLYNLALFTVVLIHFFASWPGSKVYLTRDSFLGFFFLAVLANIAYCAAYAVDLFVSFSGQREVWMRRRWLVLLIGIAFGAVIAHFFTMVILSVDSSNGYPPG